MSRSPFGAKTNTPVNRNIPRPELFLDARAAAGVDLLAALLPRPTKEIIMLRFGCGLVLLASCLCLAVAPAPAPAQKGAKDLLTTLKTIGVFKSWAKVVETAGLQTIYGTAKPAVKEATMFVPNEDAFARLKDDEKAAYFDSKNKPHLIKLVTAHVIEGHKYDMEQLGKKDK